jgi:hypothetical protein
MNLFYAAVDREKFSGLLTRHKLAEHSNSNGTYTRELEEMSKRENIVKWIKD